MIAWMLYSAVVTAIVAGAGRAAESLARVLGYRMRWIWAGALLLTAFLSVSSALRRVEPTSSLTLIASTRQGAAAGAATNPTWLERAQSAANSVFDGTFTIAARSIDAVVPASGIKYAAFVWLAASLLLAAVFAAVIHGFQRARRHWPRGRVHDVPVRVSPSVGPIVIGVMRPEIVVPRWLLHRADDELRLAVAHEQEHLRARDPLLLGIGWAMVVLAPWNAALWYMVSRLRLAIELDCDARVLRRGAAPRAYGSLLIEVAQNSAPLTLSALGFADESSQLYHRILALRAPSASFARTRAAVAVIAVVASVLVACRITPPQRSTAVAEAPRAPVVSVPVSVASQSSRDTAGPATRPRARRASIPIASSVTIASPTQAEPASRQSSDSAALTVHLDSVVRTNGPLILIDGARSTMEEMHALDPKTIDHVEVLKGTAAVQAYGSDAARGVITITTKSPR
jgi:beta-lactamase regulating signal transducer with metallopeptidase domain